jgi:hypothetical protein
MKRENIVWGLILILLGAGFLVYQFNPGLFDSFRWPWILIGIGAIFVLGSLIGRVGGLMIPGVILLGLGGIFYYQDTTGNWESWAYIWTLLPALAGLGMLLGSLYDRELRQARGVGIMLLLGGLAAFAIFGGFFGLGPEVLRFWPVLIILFGVWLLIQALRTRK